ncbi:MAG TPA: TonB-dependent receptor plug domain-containing protein, partial [Paracoccaceae bacterium]|nr:TonB-dependent receptor plug domain-containing protein [Paracoccaceae bacterium]
MSRIRSAAIAAFVSPIAIAPALAQEPLGLPPVIVTGGLVPIDAAAYGRSVSVITAEEIEARGIDHVAEALRTVPGVSVSQSGGHGLTKVRLRGAEGNHTLVLIDGIEVAAPEQGEYNFGGLLAADIERIEVLRGPQSALYGSNALGGVISIITKRASEPGLHWRGEAEAGTDGTGAGFLALRGSGEPGSFSVSLARRETEGFDISDTPGGEEDGDRNLTLNARGELDLADWLTVGGTFRLTDRHSDTDGFAFAAPSEEELVFDDHSALDRRETMGSLFAIAERGRFRHEARATYLTADDQTTDAGVNLTESTATRRTVSLRSTMALDAPTLAAADHSLTVLAENERETFENTDPALVFDPSQLGKQTRNLFGVVAEYRGSFLDVLDLQVGLRHDVNDEFADATTWSAGAS